MSSSSSSSSQFDAYSQLSDYANAANEAPPSLSAAALVPFDGFEYAEGMVAAPIDPPRYAVVKAADASTYWREVQVGEHLECTVCDQLFLMKGAGGVKFQHSCCGSWV